MALEDYEKQMAENPQIEWMESGRNRPKSEFWKNLGVAAALVVATITIRCGALPGGEQLTDGLLAAVTQDSLLDDQLGRLSFVSALFPETAQVFGENSSPSLRLPYLGEIAHAWTQCEPYILWCGEAQSVYSSLTGEVTSVDREVDGTYSIAVQCGGGVVCVYGGISHPSVMECAFINAGEEIGRIEKNGAPAFEVRVDGVSVDPAKWMENEK